MTWILRSGRKRLGRCKGSSKDVDYMSTQGVFDARKWRNDPRSWHKNGECDELTCQKPMMLQRRLPMVRNHQYHLRSNLLPGLPRSAILLSQRWRRWAYGRHSSRYRSKIDCATRMARFPSLLRSPNGFEIGTVQTGTPPILYLLTPFRERGPE